MDKYPKQKLKNNFISLGYLTNLQTGFSFQKFSKKISNTKNQIYNFLMKT